MQFATFSNDAKKCDPQDVIPASVSVQLQQPPSLLVPTLFAGQDLGGAMEKLSEWNNGLVSLALHFQEQISDLLVAQQQPSLLIAQSFKYPPLLLESTTKAVPVLPPAELDLSRPCCSDYKHGVRRVYTKGLAKKKGLSMKRRLAKLGVDRDMVVFSHVLPFETREFIVVGSYEKVFCEKIRESGYEVMDRFNPLCPQHLLFTDNQRTQYPELYRATLAPLFRASRGKAYNRYKSYARDFGQEIGLGPKQT